MSTDDKASPVQGGVMPQCPRCRKPTKMTWNWCQGQDGCWYHECWECGNVMETEEKVIEV